MNAILVQKQTKQKPKETHREIKYYQETLKMVKKYHNIGDTGSACLCPEDNVCDKCLSEWVPGLKVHIKICRRTNKKQEVNHWLTVLHLS